MNRQRRAFHRWTGFLSIPCTVLLLSCGGDGGGTPTVPPPTASAILYVKAPNTQVGDQFGGLIAASADGTTLAVAAGGEASNATGINGNQTDNSAPQAGAVYVFTRDSGGNVSQTYVKASNAESLDSFGSAVVLSADGTTLVVGAVGEGSNATGINGNQTDNSFSTAGAVYVFTRNAGVWLQQAYVKASNTEDDQFGHSIALSADGNTLVVGAVGEDSNAIGINGNQADNSAPRAGAVYVFTRNGAAWSQQAYVKASNTGAGDLFGFSVALSANGNTLAVGAYSEASAATGINGNQTDNSAPQAGAVYVFTRNAGVWLQQAYVKASNTGAGDFFGLSIALSADGSALAVGAEHEDSNGIGDNQVDNTASGAGAVYVFTRSGAVWSQQAYLKASNAETGDFFGSAVVLSADGSALAVGATNEDSNATGIDGSQADNSALDAGAVYVFRRSGAVWSQQAYVKASNTGAGDFFGLSIALSADGSALAVGAEHEDSNGINGNQADNSAPDAGAVYIY